MKIVLQKNAKEVQQLSVFFNNNARATTDELLSALFHDNGYISFPPRRIFADYLLAHAIKSGNPFEDTPVKKLAISQNFRANFLLLSTLMQKTLLRLLQKIEGAYNYSYGTVENLSAYQNVSIEDSNLNSLDFYINIKSAVGGETAHDYIATLKDYEFASITSGGLSLPLETIIFSRWEHLKNGKNAGIYPTNNLYCKMLEILKLPITTDAFEVDLDRLVLIIQMILE